MMLFRLDVKDYSKKLDKPPVRQDFRILTFSVTFKFIFIRRTAKKKYVVASKF